VRQCLVEKLKEKSIHVIYGFRAEKVLKVKNPEETGEKYLFEIQPYIGRGFDNHLNHNIRNNLEPDNTGIGNPSYGYPAADISGSGKHSIDNYILNREPFSVFARKVILATGGRTYPQTGSTGDGYKIAKNLGHSISELSPYLLPVFSKDRDIALLAGVSLKEAGLKILAGKKVISKNTGSILFTHRGLSGPCAVSIGHEVYKLLYNKYKKDPAVYGSSPFDEHNANRGDNKMPAAADYKDCDLDFMQDCSQDLMQNFDKDHKQGHSRGPEQDFFVVSIDLAPDLSFEDFKEEIFTLYKSNPKKELLTILNMTLKNIPERLLDLILTRCKITKNLKTGNLSKVEISGIYNTIKNLEFKIDSALHFDEAIVTDGGIPVKEINPRDMQSVLAGGLYFAGEIIGLAGPEGGFNLQKAFSTGWLAGKSAAESLNLSNLTLSKDAIQIK
jgi:predicted flavoprotein YhiN